MDLESGQVALVASLVVPPVGPFFFFHLSQSPSDVMVRKEEVGGTETHEIDIPGPHPAQDTNEAQPVIPQVVISQVEGVTSIFAASSG